MKRIVYRREYDVTIVETYEVEVPESLADDDSTEGKAALDEYVTTNHDADYEDRLGMVEDSLVPHVTVLGDVADPVRRVDRYTVAVEGHEVTAGDRTEQRLRLMSAEERDRFLKIMGKR